MADTFLAAILGNSHLRGCIAHSAFVTERDPQRPHFDPDFQHCGGCLVAMRRDNYATMRPRHADGTLFSDTSKAATSYKRDFPLYLRCAVRDRVSAHLEAVTGYRPEYVSADAYTDIS